ncbi:ATP-dependent helicase [Alicyclobacillus acidoterrestris]|nr:ATP-dependent helicase [Alicyclobacillus acidoterrestris]
MTVRDETVIIVSAKWLPTRGFLVYGETEYGEAVDAEELALQLFQWDPDSYYGTLCEFTEWEGLRGIYLSPLAAIRFFARSGTANALVQLDYRPDYEMLQRVAVKLLEALREGWFAPDYQAWLRGEFRWRLRMPNELDEPSRIALEYLDIWVHQAIAEHIETHSELQDVFHQLLQEYPNLTPAAGTAAQESLATIASDSLASEIHLTDLYVDEPAWLTAIGWMQDQTPFRVGLQLVEPAQGEAEIWRLQVVVQDKLQVDQVVPVASDGISSLPPAWLPFRDQFDAQVNRIRRLVSYFSADDDVQTLCAELDGNQAFEFLSVTSQVLSAAGVPLFVPAWWAKVQRAAPRLKASVRSTVGAPQQSLFGLNQTIAFDWRYALGEIDVSDAEFADLLAQKQRLVRFRGHWIQIDPDFYRRAQRLKEHVARRNGLSLRDVIEMYLMSQSSASSDLSAATDDRDETVLQGFEVELNQHLYDMMRTLEQQAEIPVYDVPKTFRGALRPYQKQGFSWLLWLRKYGFGACLADDMGLGKTVQYIAYLLAIREAAADAREQSAPAQTLMPHGASLLICPTSVLGNWQKELERFGPDDLRIYIHYGPSRLHGEAFEAKVKTSDIVITTYTLANLDEQDLTQVEWNSICLDEAQNIKNAHTKQSQAIRRLQASHRIAMTGTPMENRLTELWSIFDFINPGYLGSLRKFSERFVQPIERTRDAELIRRVQRMVRPFLLRRVKTDPRIELDLPDKVEAKVYVPLTAEQAALYESVLQDMLEKLDTLMPMERRGVILATLTRLKQICDHPSLALKDSAEGRVSLARSAKVERLVEMVSELRAEGDQCLVFTQFVEAGTLLQRALEEVLEEPVLFLHGGVQKAKRDEMIAAFQSGDDSVGRPGVFVLSLKAGGAGLNLTAANHVFHFDRWWNPAIENQATDRAFRIGQTKRVQVHKFVALGTLEERIDEMIERKLALSEDVVGLGEQWITELSSTELRDLFALRREWVTD